ncbi:acylphosphatase [Gracilinema caldarium]|uniref:Acylphosphatase n=1 Tax=Gracilinema caldarium (strain ATCC 51460 / DSM 7334 / H1) TaxID=744872 RepID=F8EYQ9_GRAC1|nr:acylphosphatase [Gracilinema caldarium]AEJ18636.1 Acylphosphatase [Gracilinema caldarium DSM 7334]
MSLDDALPKEAVLVQVYGIVQGVGFRYAAQAQARKLGVVGWVKNCHDGSVEVYAEGNPAKLSKLISWLHHGPPAATVDRVQLTRVRPIGSFHRFSIEY